LILFEDTHWIDPTSIELMGRIVRRVVDLPAMIIVTYWSEFTPPWLDLGHVTMLNLNYLGRSKVVDLIRKTVPPISRRRRSCSMRWRETATVVS
jgi:predicted ATPase